MKLLPMKFPNSAKFFNIHIYTWEEAVRFPFVCPPSFIVRTANVPFFPFWQGILAGGFIFRELDTAKKERFNEPLRANDC